MTISHERKIAIIDLFERSHAREEYPFEALCHLSTAEEAIFAWHWAKRRKNYDELWDQKLLEIQAAITSATDPDEPCPLAEVFLLTRIGEERLYVQRALGWRREFLRKALEHKEKEDGLESDVRFKDS